MLLRQAAGLDKGSQTPGQGHRRHRSPMAQVEEIAKIKMPDLNANDLEAAKLQVAGTARSMGLTVSLADHRTSGDRGGPRPGPLTTEGAPRRA